MFCCKRNSCQRAKAGLKLDTKAGVGVRILSFPQRRCCSGLKARVRVHSPLSLIECSHEREMSSRVNNSSMIADTHAHTHTFPVVEEQIKHAWCP